MHHKMAVLAVRTPRKNYKILRYFLVFEGFSVFSGSWRCWRWGRKGEAGRAVVGAKPGAVLVRSGDGVIQLFFLGNNREITIKYSGK